MYLILNLVNNIERRHKNLDYVMYFLKPRGAVVSHVGYPRNWPLLKSDRSATKYNHPYQWILTYY